MADNLGITPGSGATIAADDVGGNLHQRVKVSLGADGAAVDAEGGAGNVGAGVQRMTLAANDPAVSKLTDLDSYMAGDYETVAASQTDQTLGVTGGVGDVLVGILIVPATLVPGTVSIKDGSGAAITIFTGGADSVSNMVPFLIPLGIKSVSGAWKVTTGTNVSVIGMGKFT